MTAYHLRAASALQEVCSLCARHANRMLWRAWKASFVRNDIVGCGSESEERSAPDRHVGTACRFPSVVTQCWGEYTTVLLDLQCFAVRIIWRCPACSMQCAHASSFFPALGGRSHSPFFLCVSFFSSSFLHVCSSTTTSSCAFE